MANKSKKKSRDLDGGKYYWELQDWVNKLFIEYDKCCICKAEENLEPHHVLHVKQYDKYYTNLNNGLILCKSCHRKYHESYKTINPASLLDFALNEFKQQGGLNSAELKRKLKN